jgi:hypothetical protein
VLAEVNRRIWEWIVVFALGGMVGFFVCGLMLWLFVAGWAR